MEKVQGTGLYVLKTDFAVVKKQTTATAVARTLMDAVFTKEAMKACSVYGKPSKSKGSDKMTIRSPLNAKAMDEIISKAPKII